MMHYQQQIQKVMRSLSPVGTCGQIYADSQ